MHRQAAVDILKDGAVARGVGDGQVQARLDTVREVGGVDAELLLRKLRNGFVDRGEIIQHILRPDAQSHDRARIARAFVDGFGQEQQVGDQPGLVHAVGDADVVARGRKGAVFRGPEDGVVRIGSAAGGAARENIEVGQRVFAPVHGASRDSHAVGTEIDGARSGFRLCGKNGQRSGAEHGQKLCFHKHRCIYSDARCKSDAKRYEKLPGITTEKVRKI